MPDCGEDENSEFPFSSARAGPALHGGAPLSRHDTEVGKQSHKTLLDVFERYIEGYMTLFDTI